jgi:uncharacterized protein GlcG (DUF336 family)
MARMTLTLAEECIKRVKLKATEMSVDMSIAVVDNAGKLVAYARMGHAPGSFTEKLSMAKAKTAVAYGRDTKATMKNFAERPGNYYIIGMSGLYPDDFWAGPGGVPIIIDGELVGGVGVSGSTAENDHRCVVEALKGIEKTTEVC